MSEYKGIKGFQVQTRTSDPVPFAQAVADDPYVGSWSSGGNMNVARYMFGGNGTQTAALASGGVTPAGLNRAESEEYDGSSWTEGNDLNTGRYGNRNSGTQTAALTISGKTYPPGASLANVESYDGSSYTEVGDVNTARINAAAFGTSTASFFVGGDTQPNSFQSVVESWNGSAWTETTDLNTARNGPGGDGVTTNAIVSGGSNPGSTEGIGSTEQWNGSAWTEVADLNQVRYFADITGVYNTAIIIGGVDAPSPGKLANTESWDNSSWTEVNDLSTARRQGAAGGTSTLSVFFGGEPPTSDATEEWAFSGVQPGDEAGYSNAIIGDFYYNSTTGQFKNVSSGVGSWASGGNLNGGRYGIMGAGTLTAGLAMGGTFQPSDTTKNTAETYNGISWTNAPTLPGNIRDGGSWGVQTSAVQVGGSTSPGATPFGSTAYEFDGSSFSNGGSLNTARRYNAGAGAASTAGITFGGGNPGPYVAITESYDGSTFTEVADLNTARNYLGAAGTQTAAIAAGGNTGSDVANVELWDGSSWTETTDINTARGFASPSAGMGSQTAAIVVSGNPNNVESWDGTSWTEIADLGTSRSSGHTVGFNSTSAGMYFGGSPNSYATYTEEWDQPDFQIKSVTTS